MKKIIFLMIPLFLFVAGCEKNPVGALLYPDVTDSQDWADTFILYDDIIKTRGPFDPFMFTDWKEVGRGDLNFEYNKDSYKGTKSIKMTWDGGASSPKPAGAPQIDYVGFGAPAKDFYEPVPGQPPYSGYDISMSSYTKMEMWIKGTLRKNVQIEIKAATDISEAYAGIKYVTTAELPNDGKWHKITVPFTNRAPLSKVKVMFSVVMKTIVAGQKSNGADIYIDEIRFTQ